MQFAVNNVEFCVGNKRSQILCDEVLCGDYAFTESNTKEQQMSLQASTTINILQCRSWFKFKPTLL
jgi:hypothetical protein